MGKKLLFVTFSLLLGRPPGSFFSLLFRCFEIFGVLGSVSPFAPHNSCDLNSQQFESLIAVALQVIRPSAISKDSFSLQKGLSPEFREARLSSRKPQKRHHLETLFSFVSGKNGRQQKKSLEGLAERPAIP